MIKGLACPICGEIIVTPDMIRSDYDEIWFDLSDGSKMKVALCANCKITIDDKKIQQIFDKVVIDWKNGLQRNLGHKKSHIDKLDKLDFLKAFDNQGVISTKTKKK